MKATALIITRADFDPQTHKVVHEAFGSAWEEIAPNISPDAIQAARVTLAEIVLSLARSGTVDEQALTDAAVRGMLSLPQKL
jgi:hypothetical protein